MDKEFYFPLNEFEEHIDKVGHHQFSSSYLLLESQFFEIFHTHKETKRYDFIIEKIYVCCN